MGLFERYVAVGGIATCAQLLCLIALVELAGWSPLLGTCFGALVGALVSYSLNYRLTFVSSRRHRVALPRFLVIATIAFFLNAIVFYGLFHLLVINYVLLQLITTSIVLLFTFSAAKFWAFR